MPRFSVSASEARWPEQPAKRHKRECGIPSCRQLKGATADSGATTHSEDSSMTIDPKNVLAWYDVVRLHQGEWAPDVIICLIDGPQRFMHLLSEVRERQLTHPWSRSTRELSKQSLSRLLHTMERNELILRHEDQSDASAAVSYELSPAARSFLEQRIYAVAEWAAENQDLISRAQQRRREARETDE
jgi:DNA-binding HxlR family transcriptional regulator